MVIINPFLFYPNLIGYIRMLLALLSFHFMHTSPSWWAVCCYITSAFLDVIDGYVARACKQNTAFGALFDQLLDRLTLLGLLMILCNLYPSWMLVFQSVAILDIAAHWLHIHATVLTGKKTHKASSNPILHYYYSSKFFFFMMCFGKEAFYLLLYINIMWQGPSLFGLPLIKSGICFFFPIACVKTLISVILLVTASKTIGNY